jgi:hypothetical protein
MIAVLAYYGSALYCHNIKYLDLCLHLRLIEDISLADTVLNMFIIHNSRSKFNILKHTNAFYLSQDITMRKLE